jgi:hypothetical protein
MQKFSYSFAVIQQTKLFSGKLLYQGLTVLMFMGLCSCATEKSPQLNLPTLRIGANVTQIRNIKPVEHKETKETTVYIQGKVEKHAPLVKQQAYQIADATGKIWVVTNQSNLKVGQEVVLKGKVKYKSIPLAGQEYGEVYLEEE